MPLPEIYSARALADHFGVSVATIERDALETGNYVRVGRHEFFTEDDVAALIDHWRARR